MKRSFDLDHNNLQQRCHGSSSMRTCRASQWGLAPEPSEGLATNMHSMYLDTIVNILFILRNQHHIRFNSSPWQKGWAQLTPITRSSSRLPHVIIRHAVWMLAEHFQDRTDDLEGFSWPLGEGTVWPPWIGKSIASTAGENTSIVFRNRYSLALKRA